MILSLDANVFVYANIIGKNIKNREKREEWVQLHRKADILYNDVLKGRHEVIIPSVIVAEVCTVISRMTNLEEEGLNAAREIQQYCIVVYESKRIFDELLPIIAQIKGSGIDSILAAVAMKASAFLITNDKRLYKRLKSYTIGIDLKLLADMSVNDARTMGET